MSITFCTLLWPRPGKETELIAYEDKVLDLVGEHGGSILSRYRTHGKDDQPLEIQIFEFESQERLDAYLVDERRVALAGERDSAIDRTELMYLTPVHEPR
ncbi:MAG: hypothetical protein JWP10_1681 [Nocardioidaceae bacterium]|nr:hypothetical protein [Nocardioidaceae bacterium]